MGNPPPSAQIGRLRALPGRVPAVAGQIPGVSRPAAYRINIHSSNGFERPVMPRGVRAAQAHGKITSAGLAS
jgi:hypothetical protein